MALIDTGTDVWLIEYESCERLYGDILGKLNERDSHPRASHNFNDTSATVRLLLTQFNVELSQLEDRLKITSNLTSEERERRQRLIEDLVSKFVCLTRSYKTSTEVGEREQLFGPNWQDEECSDDVPLLGSESTVEDLRRQQKEIVAEQDRGLENLSTIIGRQKSIAIVITNEVNAQNDIIDDLSTRMDATTSGIRNTTTTVTTISRSDSTWLYWLIIVLLFFCILAVVF